MLLLEGYVVAHVHDQGRTLPDINVYLNLPVAYSFAEMWDLRFYPGLGATAIYNVGEARVFTSIEAYVDFYARQFNLDMLKFNAFVGAEMQAGDSDWHFGGLVGLISLGTFSTFANNWLGHSMVSITSRREIH